MMKEKKRVKGAVWGCGWYLGSLYLLFSLNKDWNKSECLSCPEAGQEVVGATSRVCLDNGQWEPELPFCGRFQISSSQGAHMM